MSIENSTSTPSQLVKRVLIIENEPVVAARLEEELEDLGCECVRLIQDHLHQFEAAFKEMYPAGEPVKPEAEFQGVLLDVMFVAYDNLSEKNGGRDLYKFWRDSKRPCILDHLGIILVVTDHEDARGIFADIDVFEGPKFRITTYKNSAKLLKPKLDQFVADL